MSVFSNIVALCRWSVNPIHTLFYDWVCYFTILSKTPYGKNKSPIVGFFQFLRFHYSTTVVCYFTILSKIPYDKKVSDSVYDFNYKSTKKSVVRPRTIQSAAIILILRSSKTLGWQFPPKNFLQAVIGKKNLVEEATCIAFKVIKSMRYGGKS